MVYIKKLQILLISLFLLLCVSLAFSEGTPSGQISYVLAKNANPTADESDAYARITKAMDSAIYYYNTYSTASKKLNIQYVPSVSTADGNSNGSIRFGSNRSYMVALTAMHEIAHTLGIGTTTQYQNLLKNNQYTGPNGIEALKSIDGESAVLKGDKQHFWPYGLNYSSEVKSTADLINHVKIVDAILKDMYPTDVCHMTNENKKRDIMLSGRILECNLDANAVITLNIFTLNGKNVYKMQSREMAAGSYKIDLGEFPLSKGYYWYNLIAGHRQYTGIYCQK